MCGIAGFAPFDPAAPPAPDAAVVLAAMREAIHHRGPDQGDQRLIGGVGLAARRLAIIDRAGSDQPISIQGGRVTVVFNGEIYNYRQLRAEVAAAGAELTTAGDTEVIAWLYAQRGIEGCLEALRGMFAFAVYDAAERALYLARDRFGIKPLYLGRAPGDRLLFGSELHALAAHPGFAPVIDDAALGRYLLFEFVPAPATIYAGVEKLPSGCYAELKNGELRTHRYWHPAPDPAPPRGLRATLDALDGLLAEAVAEQMVSEVPLGVLLSGGLDSSTVAWYAARHREAAGGDRLRSFSIGFSDPSFDEGRYFRAAAERIGTEHHSRTVDRADIPGLLEKAVALLDEPLGDGSLVPTLALCELVASAGVTVVLSGDGGDEPFGGYPTYLAHDVADRIPAAATPLLRRAAESLRTSYDNVTLDFKAKRFAAGFGRPFADRNAVWLGASEPEQIRALLGAGPATTDDSLFADHRRHLTGPTAPPRGADPALRAQHLDLHTYLADDILAKVDRAAMSLSLEVRPPLLDHRIVGLALALPTHLRRLGTSGKVALRLLMARRLPRPVVTRGKKGFGLPTAHWLRGEGRAHLLETLSGPAPAGGRVDPKALQRLVSEHLEGRADHRRILWGLLVFEMWLSRRSP